jgi:hypothetical protein
MRKIMTHALCFISLVLLIHGYAFEIKGFGDGSVKKGHEKDKCSTLYNSDYMYMYASYSNNCSYWSASYSSSISKTKTGKERTEDFYWYFSLYMYSTCSGSEIYVYGSNSSYDNPNWRDDPKTVIEYPDSDINPRETFFVRVCVVLTTNANSDTNSQCIPVEFEVTVNKQVSENQCKGWNIFETPYPIEGSSLCIVSQSYTSEGEGFSISNAFLRMMNMEYQASSGAAYTSPYVSLTRCGACSGN